MTGVHDAQEFLTSAHLEVMTMSSHGGRGRNSVNSRDVRVNGASRHLHETREYERTLRLLCAMAALDTIGKARRRQGDTHGLLDDLGITEQDVDLLLSNGLVSGSSGEPVVSPSALQVTLKGRRLLRECRHDLQLLDSSLSGATGNESKVATPTWNRNKRMLLWGSLVIKSFRKTAPNQEILLDSFEEEGWPARIDDPIPPSPGIVPTVRLHDTIKRLNHGMAFHVIRFYGDGTGLGVEWRRLAATNV
jgi:hypothetical protein